MLEFQHMNIILLMVASVDGKTTKGDIGDPTVWNSKEDRDLFSEKRDNASLIIMGSKTYVQAKKFIKVRPETLRIVMTRNSQKFENDKVLGQLEFSDKNPNTLIEELEKKGYTDALLLGGANLNSSFFKSNLVDKLWLTIEPRIFGTGNGVVGDIPIDVNMKLLSIERLNNQGTVLLKYKVL